MQAEPPAWSGFLARHLASITVIAFVHVACERRSACGVQHSNISFPRLVSGLPRLSAAFTQSWEVTCTSGHRCHRTAPCARCRRCCRCRCGRSPLLPAHRSAQPLALNFPPIWHHRLLYWTAAEGAGRREAHDALAAAILCLGGATAGRWATQVSLLRAAPPRSAMDDPPAARQGGASGLALHRVTLSDEPEQVFLLSR